ncbi:MAG: hypothetical protein AAFX93_19420 [Verrucomicrobiota bacterium]
MVIETKHIGMRGVFRDKRKLVQGVIQEISPSKTLFRINSATWLENTTNSTVELLPDLKLEEPTKPRRAACKSKKS